MKAILRISLALGLFSGTAHAFSLLGPYDSWMQPTNGFRLPNDIGGPMNLGEEYRWNVPVLAYAFDASFLDYFGSNGVLAVEQAIQILNALPPASQIDPTNYPPEATRVNYQAQSLNLIDVKSKTLVVLLEELGLAQPTRHTYDVQDFGFVNGNPVAQTVMRNFDPLTFVPTNWVNDTGYGYVLAAVTNGPAISVTAEEFPVDPLATIQTAVADDAAGAGGYYTGLTRDDIGGLRYLFRTNNVNLEPLLPNVHGVGPNAVAYANQALRPGVDKITLVRRDYDDPLGQFFTPYTNQFTDYYISNNAVVVQQLERVITEPDIVFSAGNDAQGIATDAQISRTGTSNWWHSAILPGANGSGLIRPPIKLTLSKPVELVITADWLPNPDASNNGTIWGTFDSSTNPPVVYPVGAVTTGLTLDLQLMHGNAVVGDETWQIPLLAAESIQIQTSTDLTNWVPYLVFRAGQNVKWLHSIAHSQRYFRIVPNN